MKRNNLNELIEELTALAGEYPDQPEWQELLDRVRKETKVSGKSHEQRPCAADPESSKRDPVCCCVCEIAPAMEGENLCRDCAAMYPTVSARVVADPCDCGHVAEGARAYRYRNDGKEETLCGLKCVRAHFREVFGVFLGSTKVGDRHGRVADSIP